MSNPGSIAPRHAVACLLLLLLSVGGAATDLAGVDLPMLVLMPGAQGQWVSKKMALNGLPMSIYGFTTRADVDAVRVYYTDYLRSRGIVAHTDRSQGSVTVGGADEKHYYSVQLTPHADQVEALLVVSMRPDLATPDKVSALPLPSGVEIKGKYEYLDAGQLAESVDFVADTAAHVLARNLAGRLERTGWTVIMAERMRGEVSGWTGEFQRDGEQLQAQLMDQPGGGVHGMIHWRK